MASTAVLQDRLDFKKSALAAARSAYLALLNGNAKSYTIGGKELTHLDLPALNETIAGLEKEIDLLEVQIAGGKSRRAYGIVPRDW